jgi:hypothetical protein
MTCPFSELDRLKAENALLRDENALLERRLKVAADAFRATDAIVQDLWQEVIGYRKPHEVVYGTVQINAGLYGARIYRNSDA